MYIPFLVEWISKWNEETIDEIIELRWNRRRYSQKHEKRADGRRNRRKSGFSK